MDADPRVLGEGGRGQPESTSPGWSPEHGGAKLLSDAGGFRETARLTRRSRGRGEAVGADRRSRRVVASPEWLTGVAAAARARRREAEQHLQGTRASELGVRRLSATRGSELSRLGRQWLTGEEEIGDGTRRRQRLPATKCGSLAARYDGGAEGKWSRRAGLYSHADARSQGAVTCEKSTGSSRGIWGRT